MQRWCLCLSRVTLYHTQSTCMEQTLTPEQKESSKMSARVPIYFFFLVVIHLNFEFYMHYKHMKQGK